MTDRLDALAVRVKDGKSYWTKIGAAWAGKTGGWIVRLDAMPAPTEGQFVTRKQIALDAYMAGHSAREAARIAGLSRSYVQDLAKWAGISRPSGRPRKHSQGSAGREA